MNTPCPDAKGSIGSSLCPPTCLCLTCLKAIHGSEASSNEEKEDSYTGSSASPLPRKLLFPRSKKPLDKNVMPNLHEVKQRQSTFGKKRLGLKELNLNLAPENSNETMDTTGTKYGKQPKQVLYMKSHLQYEFKVTELSEQSVQTLRNQLEWSDLVMYTGVQLALESQGKLGSLPEWTLTLKIQTRSSGVDTMVRKMLLSMNLEEELMSHTCCAGWTDIRSMWKLKEAQSHFVPKQYGSQAI